MRIVLVPGNFGSTLANNQTPVWVNPFLLAIGGFGELKLGPYRGPLNETNANKVFHIAATGLVPGMYSLLEMGLWANGFKVVQFPYDWRLDIEAAATRLNAFIAAQNDAVILVTHSMGGPICRRAVQLSQGAHVAQLIMLAPSIGGTLVSGVAITASLQDVPYADKLPTLGQLPMLKDTLKTFSALYQIFPWDPAVFPSLNNPVNDVRSPAFWGANVDAARFQALSGYGATIDTAFFNDRTQIVLGCGAPTIGALYFDAAGALQVDHTQDMAGDGFMATAASVLPGVATYTTATPTNHIELPSSVPVIEDVIRLVHKTAPLNLVREQ